MCVYLYTYTYIYIYVYGSIGVQCIIAIYIYVYLLICVFVYATPIPLVVRVNPASSHTLASEIKPCMSRYKLLDGVSASGSLNDYHSFAF